MINSKSLRASLLVTALCIACSAQATSIYLVSQGYYLPGAGGSNPYSGDNESVAVQLGGYGLLSTLSYTLPLDVLPRSGTGFFEIPPFDGTVPPAERLNFDLTVTGFSIGAPTFLILYGTWTAVSGLGSYQGVTGGGLFSTVINLLSGSVPPSYSVFQGEIEAVPEPATIAALALGCSVLLGRRRR